MLYLELSRCCLLPTLLMLLALLKVPPSNCQPESSASGGPRKVYRSGLVLSDNYTEEEAQRICASLPVLQPAFCNPHRNNCYISFHECAAHPVQSGFDSIFAMDTLGVDHGATMCLPRAVDWHEYCKNGHDSPVTATYIPTGESLVYPPEGDEGAREHAGERWPPPPACHQAREEQGANSNKSGERVAVLIAGQLFRFSWQTLFDGLVRPNVDAGHEVDVFIYLARDDAGGMHNHQHWLGLVHANNMPAGMGGSRFPASALNHTYEAALRAKVAASLGSARSRLVGWFVGAHWRLVEDIGEWRFSQWTGRDRLARIYQYEGWGDYFILCSYACP